MAKEDEIQILPEYVEISLEIFEQLAQIRPEHSMSFILTEEGMTAIEEAIKISEWGIGGNKPKLKKTALEIMKNFQDATAGDPLNVNFTEYELKAMGEVVDQLENALEKQDEGILSK